MSNKFYGLANEVHWNPITGCDATAISPGCDNCWARAMAKRFNAPFRDAHYFTPQFHPDRLDAPSRWRKPRIVCANFMGDWMAEDVETEWIHRVLDIMSANPHHTFLTLTKRPNRLVSELCREPLIPNVWLGVSAENQECWNQRAPFLCTLKAQGWHTLVSFEPLLGPICISPGNGEWITKPDWLVIGCESGPRRRPCNSLFRPYLRGEWVRDVVRQAQALGIPCYVKQLDLFGHKIYTSADDVGTDRYTLESGRVSRDPTEWPGDLRVREYPKEFVK